MNKTFKNQVTVRIWRNIKTLGGLPTGHFGHASVTLAGMFVPCADDGKRRLQISFWPGAGGAGIGLSGVRKTQGQFTEAAWQDKGNEMSKLTALRLEVGYCKAEGIPYPDYWDTELLSNGRSPIARGHERPGQKRSVDEDGDLRGYIDEKGQAMPLWSQSPETKIALPGFMLAPRLWGLSISRMNKWWGSFKATQPKYQALSFQNCAGVALMALREGGSEAYVELPQVHLYAEPTQVEQYARLVELQIGRMETWAQELDAEIRDAAARRIVTPELIADYVPEPEGQRGLWSVQRWKQLSALGPLQPRSATIRAIDEALDVFHRTNWKDSYRSKWWSLSQVFQKIVLHRQQKADSARSAAVLGLGQQVLQMLRNNYAHV